MAASELPYTPESSAYRLYFFEFYKLLSNNIVIKKCKYCRNYFASIGRSDTLYCDRVIDDEGRTCKDIGSLRVYRDKSKNNPIVNIYNKAYKRQRARIKYKSKNITREEFFEWSKEARIMRDKALSEEITFEEFKAWLDKDF